jgi:hypothetical protein
MDETPDLPSIKDDCLKYVREGALDAVPSVDIENHLGSVLHNMMHTHSANSYRAAVSTVASLYMTRCRGGSAEGLLELVLDRDQRAACVYRRPIEIWSVLILVGELAKDPQWRGGYVFLIRELCYLSALMQM